MYKCDRVLSRICSSRVNGMGTMLNRDSYGTVHNGKNNFGLPLNMHVGYSTDGLVGYMPLMPPTSPHSPSLPPPSMYQDGSDMVAEAPIFIHAIAIEGSKRKRGRPRKYAVDGGSGTMPPPPSHLEAIFQSSGLSSPTTTPPMSSSSGNKSRGRPKGSKGRK